MSEQVGESVLILGATSAMAEETARLYAARGARLHLVARGEDRLDVMARDLRIRGAAAVTTTAADLSNTDGHAPVVSAAFKALGQVDKALLAYGTLADQEKCVRQPDEALAEMHLNFASPAALLLHLAGRMEAQQHGLIAAITSVAGDRGRQSNFVYGAAKGGLSLFLQGLRNRMHGRGVRVLTLKPGFVDTPMTAHVTKGPLFVPATVAAKCIVRAMDRKQDVAYVPGFWRWIMAVIKAVPEQVFKRMRL